ncbi:MAG TPA: glycosyltransferase family 39 protein, partial [Abditibacteriaceae bacterium]
MAKRQRIIEWGLLLLIVIFAAALRLWNLSLVPFGFHGDEAVSGLEAQRIWRENGIGPYTGAALGQPTGPIYLVALSLRAFGDSIFAVRLVSALSGTLAIVVLYGLARRHFCAQVALLAAFFLTITNWHLPFSRIGFPLGMWPLVVLLETFVLLEAIERRRIFWWIL